MESVLIHGGNRADEISHMRFLYELEKEKGNIINAEVIGDYVNKLISAQIDGYDVYRPDKVNKIYNDMRK